MLREEFAKMNLLTRTLTLSSRVQARVSDKSLVETKNTFEGKNTFV
jgi:hypothetical protein